MSRRSDSQPMLYEHLFEVKENSPSADHYRLLGAIGSVGEPEMCRCDTPAGSQPARTRPINTTATTISAAPARTPGVGARP